MGCAGHDPHEETETDKLMILSETSTVKEERSHGDLVNSMEGKEVRG